MNDLHAAASQGFVLFKPKFVPRTSKTYSNLVYATKADCMQ